MSNDVGAKFDVIVGSIADKESAKRAIQELSKIISNSVKDGYLEIALETTIDNAKSKKALAEIQKAQADLVQDLKEMSGEGFFDFEKDLVGSTKKLEAFMNKTQAFEKLLRDNGKIRTNAGKAVKALNTDLRTYSSYRKALEAELESIAQAESKLTEPSSKRKRKTAKLGTTKGALALRKRRAELRRQELLEASNSDAYLTDDEINKRVIRGLSKGAGRSKTSTPGADIQLGVRKPSWDDTYLDDKRLQANDKAGAQIDQNRWMNSLAKDMPKIRREERDSLKQFINFKMTDEAASKADRKQAYRKELGLDAVDKIADDKILAKAFLNELAHIQGGLIKNKSGIEAEDLIEQLTLVLSDAKRRDEPIDKTSKAITNMLMNRYNGAKGTFGATDGSITGEGVNQAETNEVLKDVYKILDRLLRIERNIELSLDSAEKIKNADSRSVYEKEKEKLGKSEIAVAIRERLTNILALDRQQYQQAVREGTKERVADEKALSVDTATYDTSVDSAKILADDASDGFNSEANTRAMLRKQQATNSIGDQNQSILKEMATTLSNNSEESTSKKKTTTVSVLTEIKSLVAKILTVVTGGQVDVPEAEVPTKQRKKTSKTPSEDSRKFSLGINRSTWFEDWHRNASIIKLGAPQTPPMIPPDTTSLPIPIEGKGVVDVGAIEREQELISREERLADAKAKSLIEEKKFEKERKRFLSDQLRQQLRAAREQEKARQAEVKQQIIERLRNKPNERKTTVPKTQVDVPKDKTFYDKLRNALDTRYFGSEAERIMSMNEAEQERLSAERATIFGLNNGRTLSDTGDIAQVKRTKSLFGWMRNKDRDNRELFNDVNLSKEGLIEIDTKSILSGLDKVLNGPDMARAQMGGGLFRNIIGSMTGYIGMPSLEKSRAQMEGLNEVFAGVRTEILTLIQDIQSKESTLRGMEQAGSAIFSKNGKLLYGNSAARKTLDDLEEQRQVLAAALADTKAIDQVIAASGGKVDKIVKRIGFSMPILRKYNVILKHITSGHDKNGKALKFQNRTAETLNYTLQLMARSVGQMWKNWIVQLNPLTQIKRLFNDFTEYSVKWKRTMNVIKYNLRAIFSSLMDDIAQKIVNIIGFLDIILMKIQEAFGKTPISLFDQSAADAEKMKEQLEEAANVSAGFDELHDISGDSSGGSAENDLFGDIYKPELSPEWKELAEKIGDLFKGVITGDLGFGDVIKKILEIAVEGLRLLGEAIWNWLKDSTIGQYIQKQWKSILDTLLKLFIGWELLKIAGRLLSDALFSKLLGGTALTGVLSKVGAAISTGLTKILGATSFGSGILSAFTMLFSGGKYSLIGTLKEMFTNSAAITQASSWGSMIGFAITKALLAALAGYATYKITDYFGDKAVDNASYNVGLMEAGGDEKDKKSNAGNMVGGVLGGAAGGAVTGALIGGPVGAAIGAGIGAIVGLLQTALRPALEESAVSARNLNNELQNMTYYQGLVQGYSTEVGKLSEMQRLLSETLRLNTEKVVEEGIQLGHTEERMRELTTAVLNGTFNTSMLTASEQDLKDMLVNLDAQQIKNAETTKKLEEAKKKLQKAELDLAIAEDVAAGNFELAAARVEYAMAAEVYTTEEATRKMIQIVKEGSDEQAEAILRDLSPEMTENFLGYEALTKKEAKELYKIWDDLSEDTKKAILDSVGPDTQTKFKSYIDNIDTNIRNHISTWDKMCDTIKEIFTLGNAVTRTYNTAEYNSKNSGSRSVTVPSMAVGTNYVPNDGLVYLHQGEAVIPKKYNQPYSPGLSGEEAAYMQQMISTMKSLDGTIKQGISVNGQFVQRGSDLVAVVNKTKSQNGADLLSNVSYAR